MIKVGFLVAGIKGFSFLARLKSACMPTLISSYQVKGTADDSFDQTVTLCSDYQFPFVHRRDLCKGFADAAELIFVVGWQYLLDNVDSRFVIFHDSLLPRYRGFSPTVAALINGDPKIGVTALRPSSQADCGSIYAQSEVAIKYPIKIKEALQMLDPCYQQAAKEVLFKFEKQTLFGEPQDEALATYSIWRDKQDYFIDWLWPAEKISRFVDAVGWPYDGARTTFRGRKIIIERVDLGTDITFEERHPGKLWAIRDGIPEVVCGSGMIRIVSAHYGDGEKVKFDRIRERIGPVPPHSGLEDMAVS